MEWEQILINTGYNEKDAAAIAAEIVKLKLNLGTISRLPRLAGTKIAGHPTFVIVSRIVQATEYLARIAEALEPPQIELGASVIEQFYTRIAKYVTPEMLAELREQGITAETATELTEEAFEKIGIQKAKIGKIQKIAREFVGA